MMDAGDLTTQHWTPSQTHPLVIQNPVGFYLLLLSSTGVV